jgi:cytochrome P450 enzyme
MNEEPVALLSQEPFMFNPFDPEFDANPYPVLDHMREHAPLYWWPTGNAWMVTRFEDVTHVLSDGRFSANFLQLEYVRQRLVGGTENPFYKLMSRGVLAQPEEDHARVRKLINPIFSPRGIERLRGMIQREVDALLERVAGVETIDFVTDFTYPLPVRVISAMLMIPEDLWPMLKEATLAIMEVIFPWLSEEEITKRTRIIAEAVEVMKQVIADRRRNLGDDLLSEMILAEEQSHRLDSDELVSLIMGLFVGGAHTTGLGIVFTMLSLLRHPAQMQLVRDDLTLVRSAFDEGQRFDYMGKTGPMRIAKEDLELRGQKIRKGDAILANIPAALRDPAVFADAHIFNIKRSELNKGLYFGAGAHRCFGAALARLEAQIALETLLRTYPRIESVAEPTYSQHLSLRNVVSLPLRVGS